MIILTFKIFLVPTWRVNWKISTEIKFRQAPQNNFDLALSEKGALKNGIPAKFECKIFNFLILAQANTMNTIATFLWAINHWWNFGLLISFFIMWIVNIVFIPIGSATNKALYHKKGMKLAWIK